MFPYDGFHVFHTAVAYFDVVLVKKGVVFMLSWEVLGYELEECFADVSFHIAAEGRIVPGDVTLAVSSWSSCASVFVEGKACCVTTGFESVVVNGFGFVKFVFVAGNVRNSTVNGVW